MDEIIFIALSDQSEVTTRSTEPRGLEHSTAGAVGRENSAFIRGPTTHRSVHGRFFTQHHSITWMSDRYHF